MPGTGCQLIANRHNAQKSTGPKPGANPNLRHCRAFAQFALRQSVTVKNLASKRRKYFSKANPPFSIPLRFILLQICILASLSRRNCNRMSFNNFPNLPWERSRNHGGFQSTKTVRKGFLTARKLR
jgi:hypothetical protein